MKRFILSAAVLLASLPAFAEEQVKTTAAAAQQGIGAGIVLMGSAGAVYHGIGEVNAIEKGQTIAKELTDEYERVGAAKLKISNAMLGDLKAEIQRLDRLALDNRENPELFASSIRKRDNLLGTLHSVESALKRQPYWVKLEKELETQVMLQGQAALHNEAVRRVYRRGLAGSVGAVAAGSAVYYMAQDEKIENAPAAPASAEEEKVPRHIASQLDAAQDNPF